MRSPRSGPTVFLFCGVLLLLCGTTAWRPTTTAAAEVGEPDAKPVPPVVVALLRARAETLLGYARRGRAAILDARAEIARLERQVATLQGQLDALTRDLVPLTASAAAARIAHLEAALAARTDPAAAQDAGAAPSEKSAATLRTEALAAATALIAHWTSVPADPPRADGAAAPADRLLSDLSCTRTERPPALVLICTDPTLARQAATHDQLFERVLAVSTTAVERRLERRRRQDWLNRLDRCAAAAEAGGAGPRRRALACLADAFAGRIGALKRRLATLD